MRKFLYIVFFCLLCFGQSLNAMTLKACEEKIEQAIEALNQKNHATSLKILSEIRNTAHENQWYRQEFLILNNIGANYYMMLDYGEALENYLEAYKIALTHLDNSSEMTVLNNIAILYSKENKNIKAEEYFNKAFEIAKIRKDSAKIALYAINIATLESDQNHAKNILPLLKTATNFDSKKELSVEIKQLYIDYLLLVQQFSDAEKETLNLLPQLNTKALEDQKQNLLLKISEIYLQKDDFSQALNYLKLANTKNPNLELREKLFDQYVSLYQNKQPQTALVYKDSVLWIHDSLNQVKNGQLFETNRIKFELKNSELQLAKSQASLKRERIFFFVFFGLSSLIIIAFIWAFRNSRLRQKQQLILEQQNREIDRLELEKQKQEKLLLEQELKEKEARQLLEEEKLKSEIESKNRKLATRALYQSTQNTMIEELIAALSKQVDQLNEKELKNYIQQLQQHLKQENDHETFFSHFEEINGHFLANLKMKHPDLSANDIRYLSYVYMNLSTKEISNLLNITLDACRKRKERISRKINLPENIELYNYISVL